MTQRATSIACRRYCRIESFALILIAIACLSEAAFAQFDSAPREVPWRQNVGAGQLADPGRSRVLPRPDGGPGVRTAQRISEAEASSRARLASASEDNVAAAAGQGEQWWKEDAKPYTIRPNQTTARGVSPRGQIIKESQIVAWVGSEPILAGDLLGRINEMLAPAAGQVPEQELEKQRWLLMERMLPSAIESKLVYLAFIRAMEKEQISAIRESVYEQFDEKQIERLVEQADVRSAAELEKRLRSFGSSIESVRRSFFEQVAAREMIRKSSESSDEVTHHDLLTYYQEHADDYAIEAKARWEQLMVRYDKFGSKAEAHAAIAKMGNAVLRGAPFKAVAQKQSQGFTAAQGGQHDWTTKGSLVSDVLDKAIFSLPPGSMSDILADEVGFHIIRVVEREDASRVPFRDAQVEIRDRIKEEARDGNVKQFLTDLKRDTYVWNYFEEQSQVADRRQAEPDRF